MSRLTRIAIILVASLCVSTGALAKRVAFVMGVDEYVHLEWLKKAVGDARAVKAMLEARGDTTIVAYLENPTRDVFWKEWDAFLASVAEGDEAFVHISSHGIEIDGVNYLLTKDAPAPSRGQRIIQQEGVKFGELLANLSGKNPRFSLFVLDACRNNPYAAKGTRNIGGERGLARIEPPAGAFVMYSAGINETALDRLSNADPEPTSVYMRLLLPLLKTPGLKIQDVAQQVREDVYELAATVPHKQSPTYYDNVIGRGRFCFAGCEGGAPKPPIETVLAKPEPPAPKPRSQIVYEDAAQKLIRTLKGHTSDVRGVAFSSDGRTLLSGSWDKTLKLWDAATGGEIRSFSGHAGVVWAVAFSPDGRTLLSGSGDNTLKLWDAQTGREIRTLTGHKNPVDAVAFSPDGRTLVSGSRDNTLKLWDVETGRQIRTLTGHNFGVPAVAFAPDGRTLLSGSRDNTLKLWDAGTGREIRSFTGHLDTVSTVAFAPDGRTLLSGSDDKTLKLWDAGTGREIRSFSGHTGSVSAVAFSPDGRTVLSGGLDKTLKLWDVSSGREIRSFSGHAGWVQDVAFSPDGRTVLSGSVDNTLKLWDVSEWTQPQEARR